MSGTLSGVSVHEGLTRRFAVWSLAIFSSFSGSGVVMLDHSAVWAAEDPVESKAIDPKPDSAPRKTPAQARQELARLLQAKELSKAAQFVDEAIAADPSAYNFNLSYTLSNSLDSDEAIARLNSIIDQLAIRMESDKSAIALQTFVFSVQSLASRMDRAGDRKQALEALERASETIDKLKQQSNPLVSGLISMRLGLMVKEGRIAEVKEYLDQRVEAAFEKATHDPKPANSSALAIAISQYASSLSKTHPDELSKLRDSAEKLILSEVEKEDATVAHFSPYQTLLIAKAMDLSDSDPDQANLILARLKERAKDFSSDLDEAGQRQFKSLELTLNSSVSRLKAKLLHRDLIGQKAPEFDIDAVVNMEKVQWDTLKGKVVLIDFWAVWCGPCIATFPHLKHLVHEYGDRGLVIVGVTRKYGYNWDSEAKRTIANKEATLDEELAMLAEFRKHHELEHGFVVSPDGSDYNQKFGVTGIPQAVLVDQNGVIQLIRVGSGDKNATDIENKIKELLDAK